MMLEVPYALYVPTLACPHPGRQPYFEKPDDLSTQQTSFYPGTRKVSVYHHAQRARNGAALITCDGTHLDANGGPHMMGWDGTDGNVQHYMAQLADAIHFYGSLANGVIMAFAPRGYDVSEGVPTGASRAMTAKR